MSCNRNTASSVNLKTTFGRCSPLSLPQDCDAPQLEIPSYTATLRWTRPPLIERGCCSGDDGIPEPTPYFDVESAVAAFASEDELYYFASEDEVSYISSE